MRRGPPPRRARGLPDQVRALDRNPDWPGRNVDNQNAPIGMMNLVEIHAQPETIAETTSRALGLLKRLRAHDLARTLVTDAEDDTAPPGNFSKTPGRMAWQLVEFGHDRTVARHL
jgi:hypothetical protein